MIAAEAVRAGKEALKQLLTRLETANGDKPILLFDIDDTLLLTAHRQVRILREYAAQTVLRERNPDCARRLEAVEPRAARYSVVDTAREAGVTDAALLKDLREFWFRRFFANEYLRTDVPVPGAAEYCKAARERGGRIVYLTGRDETMREGTMRALKDHGLPEPGQDGVTLILKARFDIPDEEYKTEAVERVRAMGPVLGGFENEPTHANLFHRSFPDSLTFLLETKHSGKPVEPAAGLARIPDYILR